jgi:hypothetical protein
MFKELLTETYSRVKKDSGIDVRTPRGFVNVLCEDTAFKTYMTGLCEGLVGDQMEEFMILARNTRNTLMESNTMMNLRPYETLTLPVLRNFYPKLIAKELVNVMPIDKPDVVKAFIKPYFRKLDNTGGAYGGFDYQFPSTGTDISRGPNRGITTTADTTANSINILTLMGLTGSSLASHVEKDFKITSIFDATGRETAVEILPTVAGNFAVAVTHANATTDVLSGMIDWKTGDLYWSSHDGTVSKIEYQAVASLEENTISPEIELRHDPIRLTAVDRRIKASWTSNFEQDAKALFDLNIQSELVNIIGEQIALDIDREIVNDLITMDTNQNPSTHRQTFSKTPSGGYAYGPKGWYEQMQVNLSSLSAQIYNTTFMGSGNTLACNPLDAAIFESWNNFEYLGSSTAGGEAGYKSATVASGKWKLLVSSVVPSGKIIVKYRSSEMQKASYVFAPYVPAVLSPYPLGNNPSLTVQSRYAKKAIRPGGVAILTVTA